MLTHIPFSQLGKADHGWLKANHHFSFARYYNIERMGFGTLRVINDDLIEAGRGFAAHPHDNMEIITYVRTGAIAHQDNTGNKGVTSAGEVQVMSAGTGIVHSEHNHTDEDLTLYQIWITPNKHNVEPRWETKKFPVEYVDDSLELLVSGYDEDQDKGALFIYQQARIFSGKIKKGQKITHRLSKQGYLLVSYGEVSLADAQKSAEPTIKLTKGDGAEITDINTIEIVAQEDAEVVLLDVPSE